MFFTRRPRPGRGRVREKEALLCTRAPAGAALQRRRRITTFRRSSSIQPPDMNRTELSRIQSWSILCGAALMLSLAMGMRQSLGLFQPQIIRDVGVTAAAVLARDRDPEHRLGVDQPFVGMLADRWGTRPIAVAGVLAYAAGLGLAIVARSPCDVDARVRRLHRPGAVVHRLQHRDEGHLAHGLAGAAQRRRWARSRRSARSADGRRAAGAGAADQPRLAGRADRLPRPGRGDAAGGLVGRRAPTGSASRRTARRSRSARPCARRPGIPATSSWRSPSSFAGCSWCS